MIIKKLTGGGIVSLFLNVLLIIAVVVSEHYGHAFKDALVRRGLVERNAVESSDYWAVQGWTNTLKKMNIDCDVVFLGNSITNGSDFQSYFHDVKIVNLGYSGDIIPSMIDRVEMVKAVNPEKIFIMAGTNDLAHVSIEKYVERYTALIIKLKKELPDARLYLQSVLPVNHSMRRDYASNNKIEEANVEVAKLAHQYGCAYINLYDLYEEDGEMNKELTRDGVHLKPEAYSIWADAIRERVYE